MNHRHARLRGSDIALPLVAVVVIVSGCVSAPLATTFGRYQVIADTIVNTLGVADAGG